MTTERVVTGTIEPRWPDNDLIELTITFRDVNKKFQLFQYLFAVLFKYK